MAHLIDGSTTYARVDSVTLPAGSAASTVVVVMRRVANSGAGSAYAFTPISNAGTAQAGSLGFAGTTNLLRVPGTPAAANTTTLSLTVADGWACVGWSKPAGATVTPRAHRYLYSTGVASHENAAASIGTATDASVGVVVGRFGVSGGAASSSSYAAAAVFSRELTDAEFETAAQSLSAMLALGPSSLLLFDAQNARVYDLCGGTETVAATSTVDTQSAPFPYGFNVSTVDGDPPVPGDPHPGTLSATTPAPTAALVGQVVKAGTVAATTATPTASLAGQVVKAGTITAVAPAPVASLIATVVHAGTLGATAAAPIASLSGARVANVKGGTLSAVTTAPTAVLTGRILKVATLAATAPTPAADLRGQVVKIGTLTAVAPPPAASLTATVVHAGTIAATAPMPATALAGRVVKAGSFVVITPAPVTTLVGIRPGARRSLRVTVGPPTGRKRWRVGEPTTARITVGPPST